MRGDPSSQRWVARSPILAGLVAIFLSIPIPAHADTSQLSLTLSSQTNQTFPSLLQAAEAVAQRCIQQAFQSNSQITNLSVSVLGERQGQEVPLLQVTVSRSNWQQDSRVQSWATYFSNSALLLGFVKPSQSAPLSPVVNQSVANSNAEPNFYP